MSGSRASSQSSPHIEQVAPELEKIVSTSEPIQHLATASAGRSGPPKGRYGGKRAYLLFSDIHNDRRMKYQPGKGSRCSRSRPTAPMG